MTRAQALAAVWRNTPADYKGVIDGHRTIMVYRQGTVLIWLKDLTDREIHDRLKPHERPRQRSAQSGLADLPLFDPPLI